VGRLNLQQDVAWLISQINKVGFDKQSHDRTNTCGGDTAVFHLVARLSMLKVIEGRFPIKAFATNITDTPVVKRLGFAVAVMNVPPLIDVIARSTEYCTPDK
jgi:hypothetical protein